MKNICVIKYNKTANYIVLLYVIKKSFGNIHPYQKKKTPVGWKNKKSEFESPAQWFQETAVTVPKLCTVVWLPLQLFLDDSSIHYRDPHIRIFFLFHCPYRFLKYIFYRISKTLSKLLIIFFNFWILNFQDLSIFFVNGGLKPHSRICYRSWITKKKNNNKKKSAFEKYNTSL